MLKTSDKQYTTQTQPLVWKVACKTVLSHLTEWQDGCMYQILSRKTEINNKRPQSSVLSRIKVKVRRTYKSSHQKQRANLSPELHSIQLHNVTVIVFQFQRETCRVFQQPTSPEHYIDDESLSIIRQKNGNVPSQLPVAD